MNKKAQQLGMPAGTAQNRLLKMLLFQMAKDLGRDTCFRCGDQIESVEVFSIDHKEAWLDVSPNLFWDLNNIAFSHKRCNIQTVRRDITGLRNQLNKVRKNRIVSAPEGLAWCYGHRTYLAKNLFNVNSWCASGVQRFCKECRSKGIGR